MIHLFCNSISKFFVFNCYFHGMPQCTINFIKKLRIRLYPQVYLKKDEEEEEEEEEEDNTFRTPSHQSEEYVVKLLHLLSILCLVCLKLETLVKKQKNPSYE